MIKSSAAKPERSEIGFPKLMVYPPTGNIYLMTNTTYGMLVHSPTDTKILGRSRTDLHKYSMVDYEGTVELKNA